MRNKYLRRAGLVGGLGSTGWCGRLQGVPCIWSQCRHRPFNFL